MKERGDILEYHTPECLLILELPREHVRIGNKLVESLKPNSAGLDKNHKIMSPKQMSDDYNLLLQPEETYNQAFLGVSDDGIPIYSFEALVDVASGLINNCDDHTDSELLFFKD